MTNEDLNLREKGIMALLSRFNSLFSKAQRENEETLLSWARHLAKRNFTVKQIGFALTEITKKKDLIFMPSVHEITNILVPTLPPKEFRAEKMTTEIHEAIRDTISGDKKNFLDELDLDTIKTIETLGGYGVLKQTDFFNPINRLRMVKAAMAVLTAKEIEQRNKSLEAQGISCAGIAGFDVQKIESSESEKPVRKNEQTTLKPINIEEYTIGLGLMKEALDAGEKTYIENKKGI